MRIFKRRSEILSVRTEPNRHEGWTRVYMTIHRWDEPSSTGHADLHNEYLPAALRHLLRYLEEVGWTEVR